MDLRIRGLTHLDPLTVPLPNGTEVVTRVDRLLGERRVPEGAVGRVVARAFDVLDNAQTRSVLPPESTTREEVEAWLIEQRRRSW